MRQHRTRRPAAAALAAGAAVLLAACTGGSEAAESAPGPSASASASADRTLTAALRPAGAPVEVAAGTAPGPVSVSVSRALFDSAPSAVVALADDPAGVAEGAAQAERLGVPLLLQDPAPPATTPPGATPTPPGATPAPPGATPAPPGATSAPPAADPALRAELERLRPRRVLTVGRAADLTGLPGDPTTDAAELPRSAPAPGSGVRVLVRADGGPGAAAATASARAAGATAVPVRGDDVRADPAAITALAAGSGPVVAAGDGFGPADRLATRTALAATGVQLPGGGQVLFPGRRLVALYGTPGTGSLGVLGEQGAEASVARAAQVAQPYQALSDVPVVPTFEIITTVASGSAGPDGNYSVELAVDALRPWVEKAGAAGMYVVLDLQPGRTDFLTQAKLYEDLLRLPYVGLALDAEWRLTPTQKPLQQIGSVGIAEVNQVVRWLADLTAAQRLPQKLVVLHQFSLSMIKDERLLDTSRDEVSLLIHMDGQGSPSLKDGTWSAVTAAAPRGVTFGWKNFYDEDEPMLTPAQTMTRRPTPLMISYQ